MRVLSTTVSLTVLCACVAASASLGVEPPGGLDTTWGNGGTRVVEARQDPFLRSVEPIDAVAAPNGSVFVLGASTYPTIIKLTPDGVPDSHFGKGGLYFDNWSITAQAVALQTDGKVLFAEGAYSSSNIKRLTTTGELDTTFGDALYHTFLDTKTLSVKSMIAQADASIIVLGSDLVSPPGTRLLKITPNGVIDPTFGSSGAVSLKARSSNQERLPVGMTVLGNGKIRVCTSTLSVPSEVQLNPDGSLDTSFGVGGTASPNIRSITVTAVSFDVAGGATLATGDRLFRLKAQGDFDVDFSDSFGAYVYSVNKIVSTRFGLVQRSDGRMFLAGGQHGGFGLLRVQPDGVPDPDFDSDGLVVTDLGASATALGLCVRPDGKVIVFGTAPAPTYSGNTAFAFAAYNPGPLETNTPPVITSGISSQTADRGTTTTFTVAAAPNVLKTSYHWFKNGQLLPAYLNYKPTLTISSTEATDEGSYTVEVGNCAGSAFAGPATLTVIAPPAIITQPLGYSGPRGITYHFRVDTAGRTPLTYQWQKDGVDFGAPVTNSLLWSDLPILADVSNVGDYRLVVTNSEGSVTSDVAHLSSGSSPPTIKYDLFTQDIVADRDNAAFFTVEVTGFFPMTFQLQKDGKNIGSPVVKTLADGGACQFEVPAATSSSGNYTCVVTNADGKLTSSIVTLHVWPYPVVLLNDTRLLAQDGDSFWLDSNPVTWSPLDALSYQWQFNGHNIIGEYGIGFTQDVTFASVGSYRVVVSGMPGSVYSNSASVAVVEKGQRNIYAAAGKTAKISIKAVGDGLSFHWRHSDGTPLPAGCTGVATATLSIPNPASGLYACDVTRSGAPYPVAVEGLRLVVESVLPTLQTTSLPDAAIGKPYQLPLKADHSPTKFTVTGLPIGLLCDSVSGIISGIPKASGTFNVKVTVANPVGAAPVVTLPLTVTALEAGAVGTFVGPIESVDSSVFPFGSFTLTITSASTYSGKVSYTNDSGHLNTAAFTGQWGSGIDASSPAAVHSSTSSSFTILSAPSDVTASNAYLVFDWDPTNGISGRLKIPDWLMSPPLTFYQNHWDARTHPATAFAGYYTAALTHDPTATQPPLEASGDGIASFTPSTGGTLTLAATLQDGTALTIPVFLTDQGKAWVMAWAHSYRGMLVGEIALSTGTAPDYLDSGVQGVLHWHRPASTIVPKVPIDYVYFKGFTQDLKVVGARYLAPKAKFRGSTTSPLMMNNTSDGIYIEFKGGDLDVNYSDASSNAILGTNHVASKFDSSFAKGDQVGFKSLGFNPATGRFSGTSVEHPIAGDWTDGMSGSFSGIVTRDDPTSADAYGAGSFVRSFSALIYDTSDSAHPRLIQQIPLTISAEVSVGASP